jgi:hypothetical protein
MKHKTSQSLYAYWNEMRRGRMAPRRFEIEPSRIADLLAETFILERLDSATLRFRLAGTRICEDFGGEFRGTSFLDGWGPQDRATLERRLSSIALHGAVGLFTIAAGTDDGRTARFEMLVLPLTHTDDAVDRLLGALGALQRPEWLGTARITTKRLLDHELVWPEGRPHAIAERLGTQTPFLPHIRCARIVRAKDRQFRVYEGGLSLAGGGAQRPPLQVSAVVPLPRGGNETPISLSLSAAPHSGPHSGERRVPTNLPGPASGSPRRETGDAQDSPMSLNPPSSLRRVVRPMACIAPDRRRHKRHSITLLGRFMRANRQEYPCRLQDVSVGGAAMMSPVAVEQGERIIAYFDHLGGLEGDVVRTFEGGFALRLAVSKHKREKLGAQIMWLINRHELNGAEERRHERVALPNKTSVLKLGEGLAVQCQILDVSLSGASVGTPARPAIGTEVHLGKLRARVMRHHEHGLGVQFLDIQDPEALRRYFG